MSKQKTNPTIEGLCKDTIDFVEDIQREPDRGVPIVTCAFIEDILGKMLEAYFVKEKEISNKLLNYPGPISTLSARADIAFCIGLLPKSTYEDVTIMKKIRNRFSHTRNPVDFNSKEIVSLCNKLFFAELCLRHLDHKANTRSRFLAAAISVVNTILLKALTIKHSQIPTDYSIKEIVKV